MEREYGERKLKMLIFGFKLCFDYGYGYIYIYIFMCMYGGGRDWVIVFEVVSSFFFFGIYHF